jgi:hypothetical protein
MANPDPKALQAAAATMRSQAQEARRAFVPAEGKRDSDAVAAQEAALVQKHAAEQAVKDYQTLVDRSTLIKSDAQKVIDANAKKIAEAEKKGDATAIEELRESSDRQQAIIDQAQGRLDAAQRNLDQAKVDVAERTRDLDEASRRVQATLDADVPAEKQIDALEDKARLLNEAGLKLDLARTIDNPVERADLELDAEKLLKQANAIQVDTAQITAITGQDLQLPDISTLPPMTELPDPSAATDGLTTGAGTEDTPAAGGIVDPFADGIGDDATAADPSAPVGGSAEGSDDVLGADATGTGDAAAVATASAAPDPDAAVAAVDPTLDAGASGPLDAPADLVAGVEAATVDDSALAMADDGYDFGSAAGDDLAAMDDGADAEA